MIAHLGTNHETIQVNMLCASALTIYTMRINSTFIQQL